MLLPDTGLMVGAIAVLDTLWSAHRRGAQEALLAMAHRLVVFHCAPGVRSTLFAGTGVLTLNISDINYCHAMVES